MQVNLLDNTASDIGADCAMRYPSLVGASIVVQDHIGERVASWKREARSALSTDFPYENHSDRLEYWKAQLQNAAAPGNDAHNAVDDYLGFCEAVSHPANTAFWRSQFKRIEPSTVMAQKLAGDASISARLLLQDWQKQMDRARAEWELHEIARRRSALMAQLEAFLQLLQQLQERLQDLGLEPGLLLDFSTGSLTPQDLRQLERWARYLAEDKGIRKLCDLLGKMRQVALSERVERVWSSKLVQVEMPDIHSREEIVGIRLGKDIEHVLPSELALLSDPDTALLFDLKYVESRLMCFDMQGMQQSQLHVETEEERSISEAGKKGPMVICIDTSGSMQGMPETVAKAIALSLAAKARQERRPCYLINFSTGIDTLDMSGATGMAAVLRFLQMSFHGGTDVAPALDHALQKMEEDAYKNADLLIVSDFVMSGLPNDTLARIDTRRADGNRFHSLVVAESYMTRRLHSYFDNEWIYDPDSGGVHELLGFERRMA